MEEALASDARRGSWDRRKRRCRDDDDDDDFARYVDDTDCLRSESGDDGDDDDKNDDIETWCNENDYSLRGKGYDVFADEMRAEVEADPDVPARTTTKELKKRWRELAYAHKKPYAKIHCRRERRERRRIADKEQVVLDYCAMRKAEVREERQGAQAHAGGHHDGIFLARDSVQWIFTMNLLDHFRRPSAAAILIS
mmetsp:Transcript_13309/g.40257  ORF Transcript_13309/g.40257 Transcript_13309/m.40257 type:complete len:196 (-) Transcript_13309:481-1068(-)